MALRIVWLAVLLGGEVLLARAQETKDFFLPKNPVAASYVLGRLSNKELIEAPRSEFVYVALLQRDGLERKYRLEALDNLARIRQTHPVAELIGALRELDKKGEEAQPTIKDLGRLLMGFGSPALTAQRILLDALRGDAEQPLTRELALAALVTEAGSLDQAWVTGDAKRLVDVLHAITWLPDARLRASAYPKLLSVLEGKDAAAGEVRTAAILALPSTVGHELEVFQRLSTLIKQGGDGVFAISALQRLPRKFWERAEAEPLLHALIAHLEKIPAEQRSGEDGSAVSQLALELAGMIAPDKGAPFYKALRGLSGSVFLVKTLYEQMLYDKQRLVVEAGKPVVIILQNDDTMPHNLVLLTPGSLEEIGTMAERMPPIMDAAGKMYVPESPKVLQATRLVDPGEKEKLSFVAPLEPGEYPYVCTYPGHWRRMVGVLVAVTDVDEYLATHSVTAPKVTEWKLADLSAVITNNAGVRNFDAGKKLFTDLACAQCHRLGTEGYDYGPELTDVFKRYQSNRVDVLHQILDPSLVVTNRYRNYQIETKGGELIAGLIMKESADEITVHTGPADALKQTIKKSEIKERRGQESSTMPTGLLNTLTREQILDLLAYLESGGKVPAHDHAH